MHYKIIPKFYKNSINSAQGAGEGRQLLESTQANVVFNPGNVDELKQAIATAITNLSNLEQNAHLNRELVLKRFTRDTAVDQLESVFQELIK